MFLSSNFTLDHAAPFVLLSETRPIYGHLLRVFHIFHQRVSIGRGGKRGEIERTRKRGVGSGGGGGDVREEAILSRVLSSPARPPPVNFCRVQMVRFFRRKVPVPLLGLSPKEEERLIQLVGPRYKEKEQELKLVSDRFPNRIDNKVYITGGHS